MKKIRKNEGITLVALVVTIIILIILAGVSIGLAIGNNGIIEKTKSAKERISNMQIYEEEQANELINSMKPKEKSIKYTLKAGDYVKFNTSTYGLVTYRVLYDYATDGRIEIVSNESIGNITLGGSTFDSALSSYNSGLARLNNTLSGYFHSPTTKLATDTRCVGSKPDNKNYQNSIGATIANEDIGFMAGEENYISDYNRMEQLGILNIGESYWLGSRYVEYENYYRNLEF